MSKKFTYSICEMRFNIRDTASNIEKLLTNKNVIVISIKRAKINLAYINVNNFIISDNCLIPILSDTYVYTFKVHCKVRKKHKISEIPYIINDFTRTVCYRDLHFYITGKKKIDFSSNEIL